MTCWFDGADAPRAATCACRPAGWRRAFRRSPPGGYTTALSLKVSVASGPACRFVVGDPGVHHIDALAGATVAPHLHRRTPGRQGDIVLDQATADALGEGLCNRMAHRRRRRDLRRRRLADRRAPSARPERPAVEPERAAGPGSTSPSTRASRPARARAFLTEFAPGPSFRQLRRHRLRRRRRAKCAWTRSSACCSSPPPLRRRPPRARHRRQGSLRLRQLRRPGRTRTTRGAPGGGGAGRAQRADVALRIGIAQGVMRVGVYGGATALLRRALGDDGRQPRRAPDDDRRAGRDPRQPRLQGGGGPLRRRPLALLPMKGKAEPLPVFAIAGERQRPPSACRSPLRPADGRAGRGTRPHQRLPSTSRRRAGDGSWHRRRRAGMGRSRAWSPGHPQRAAQGLRRLLARLPVRRHPHPHRAWKNVWQASSRSIPSTGAQADAPARGEVEDQAPDARRRRAAAGRGAGPADPDNDFTELLEPKARQGALHALLEACLRRRPRTRRS